MRGRVGASATLAFLALLAATVGGVRAEEKVRAEARSGTAKTKPYRKTLAFGRGYRLPVGIAAAAKPAVREAKIDGERLLIVDVDANGRFDDPLVDAWTFLARPVGTKRRFLFPLESAITLGVQAIHVEVARDGSSVAYRIEPVAGAERFARGLARLNDLRIRNGIPPVLGDEALMAAAEKHIRYMIRNGSYGHEQTRGAPEYSEEGARAGTYSVIDWGVTLEQASERWWATLFHRLPISDPRDRRVGPARGGSRVMVYVPEPPPSVEWDWPVLVPAPDTEDVPTHAGREIPLSYPEGTQPGYPITLLFPYLRSDVTDVTAELRTKGRRGKAVPVHLSTPARPAHPTISRNHGAICLIPQEALVPRTTYEVRVEYTWEDTVRTRTWSFRTGRVQRPPGNEGR